MVILLFYYCTAMTSVSVNLKLSLTKSDTKIQRSLGLKILSITSCVTLQLLFYYYTANYTAMTSS